MRIWRAAIWCVSLWQGGPLTHASAREVQLGTDRGQTGSVNEIGLPVAWAYAISLLVDSPTYPPGKAPEFAISERSVTRTRAGLA